MEQPKQIADIKSPVKRRGTRLPMKTKIAVWWILIVSVGGTIGGYIEANNLASDLSDMSVGAALFVITLLLSFFYFISGIFLTFKTKSAWIISVSILSLEIGASSILYLPALYFYPLYSPILILYIVPIILILSDKRNYWIMLSHISAKTKRKASGEVSG